MGGVESLVSEFAGLVLAILLLGLLVLIAWFGFLLVKPLTSSAKKSLVHALRVGEDRLPRSLLLIWVILGGVIVILGGYLLALSVIAPTPSFVPLMAMIALVLGALTAMLSWIGLARRRSRSQGSILR